MIWILITAAVVVAIAVAGLLTQSRRVVYLHQRHRAAALAWLGAAFPERDAGQLEDVGDDILTALVDINYDGGMEALVATVDREEAR